MLQGSYSKTFWPIGIACGVVVNFIMIEVIILFLIIITFACAQLTRDILIINAYMINNGTIAAPHRTLPRVIERTRKKNVKEMRNNRLYLQKQ